MIRVNEYLFLSTLAYTDFTSDDYGKSLRDIFSSREERDKKLGEKRAFLNNKTCDHIFDFMGDMLDKWEVHHVDNRTERGMKIGRATGFYSVTFKCQEKLMLAFRGSERFPIEDAYKDFVETDLLLGMGRRPKQFLDAVEVYEEVAKGLEEGEQIYLTGHSLGGAIAQYVAVMADRNGHQIPITCTWNALGINKNGVFILDDFVDFESLLLEIYEFSERELGYLEKLKKDYMDYMVKELKKIGYLKDRTTIKLRASDELKIDVDDNQIYDIVRSLRLETYLAKCNISTRRAIGSKEEFGRRLLLAMERLREPLLETREFADKLKENKAYNGIVTNFCHSKDFTVSVFDHIGSVYLLNEDFKEKEVKSVGILKNIFLMTKSLKNYHFEDVFIPFIISSGEDRGKFSKHLNINYVVSMIRKILYLERGVSRELLIAYYGRRNVEELDMLGIRDLIAEALHRSDEDILYQDKVLEIVRKFEEEDMKYVWNRLLERLVSPYESLDIYDLLLHTYPS